MPYAIALIFTILVIIYVLLSLRKNTRALSREEALRQIEDLVAKTRRKHPQLADAGLSIDIPRLDLHANFGSDADPTQQVFHAASVGKLFTTTVIGMLVDEVKLDIDTKIVDILPPEVCDNLFVHNEIDHRGEVCIHHLLNHTSGIADYFSGPANGGTTIERRIVDEPDKLWTAMELVLWTQTKQTALAAPGQHFYYSDTGFILLGMIIEAIEHASLHEVYRRRLFAPLQMNHSFMPYRSLPASTTGPLPEGNLDNLPLPLRPVWLNGVDVSTFRSITADWAGGGVATTANDLLKFSRALHQGQLVSAAMLRWMRDFRWHFRMGIGYGHGMMELRFTEFSPFLKSFPRMHGHMGVTGIQLFQDPGDGTAICVSVNSTRFMATSVRLLIVAYATMRRITT